MKGDASKDLLNTAFRAIVAEIVSEQMKEATPQRTIISVKEAGKRYDVHRSTIYDWMSQGIIRKHEIGGRVYVFIEDFEKSKRRN